MSKHKKILTGLLSGTLFINAANACTDIMLNYKNDYFVGRNFDWPVKNAFLVVNPIGTQHQSQHFSWASKYGNITMDYPGANNAPDTSTVLDGINQYGLTVAQLWLQDTVYAQPNNKNMITTGLWVQYLLDNAKNVNEAVQLAQTINVEPVLYQGQKVLIHLALHDAEGNSAVLEYLQGKLVVEQGKDISIPVLTNNIYAESIASLKLYQGFGGTLAIPAGYTSQARFIRAASEVKSAHINSARQALQTIFQILASVSEPQNPSDTTPTVWSIAYDLSKQAIYYRTIDNSNIRSVSLSQFQFFQGAPTEILAINNNYQGNVAAYFKKYQPTNAQ